MSRAYYFGEDILCHNGGHNGEDFGSIGGGSNGGWVSFRHIFGPNKNESGTQELHRSVILKFWQGRIRDMHFCLKGKSNINRRGGQFHRTLLSYLYGVDDGKSIWSSCILKPWEKETGQSGPNKNTQIGCLWAVSVVASNFLMETTKLQMMRVPAYESKGQTACDIDIAVKGEKGEREREQTSKVHWFWTPILGLIVECKPAANVLFSCHVWHQQFGLLLIVDPSDTCSER